MSISELYSTEEDKTEDVTTCSSSLLSLPGFGTGCGLEMFSSVQSTSHFNQQPVPPLNEVLLKILGRGMPVEAPVCFRWQTHSRIFTSGLSAPFTLD